MEWECDDRWEMMEQWWCSCDYGWVRMIDDESMMVERWTGLGFKSDATIIATIQYSNILIIIWLFSF